ncbi:hypothetical protein ACFQ8C_08790 [Streptomyces sp. NPDC056503]|uniref:hypothetical protein n=1 Tax=Streptomyces sp. NPDC056503 TaxID=3345842 RepID=UPI003691DAD7
MGLGRRRTGARIEEVLRVEVWARRQCRLAGGPGTSARARREVHRLADQALFVGRAVSQASEGDAALVASELVAHAEGACVLELTLASDGFDILVRGVPPPVPSRAGRAYVPWWDLVTRLAREITIGRAPSSGGGTIRVRIDTTCPPG